MYDRELVCSILTQISEAIETIQMRCRDVKSVSFFTDSPQGMEKRDSVCMLLMAVGESVKNLEKLTDGQLRRPIQQSIGRALKVFGILLLTTILTLMPSRFIGLSAEN